MCTLDSTRTISLNDPENPYYNQYGGAKRMPASSYGTAPTCTREQPQIYTHRRSFHLPGDSFNLTVVLVFIKWQAAKINSSCKNMSSRGQTTNANKLLFKFMAFPADGWWRGIFAIRKVARKARVIEEGGVEGKLRLSVEICCEDDRIKTGVIWTCLHTHTNCEDCVIKSDHQVFDTTGFALNFALTRWKCFPYLVLDLDENWWSRWTARCPSSHPVRSTNELFEVTTG